MHELEIFFISQQRERDGVNIADAMVQVFSRGACLRVSENGNFTTDERETFTMCFVVSVSFSSINKHDNQLKIFFYE